MKCSDCKFFKTEECKVNPKAEDFCSAENFACFDLVINRQTSDNEPIPDTRFEDLHSSAKPRGSSLKTAGMYVFWLGIVGFIIGLGISFGTFFSMPNMDTPEDFPIIAAGIVIAAIGGAMAIVGAILWSFGKKTG